MGLGFTIAAGRWFLVIVFVVMFLGIYLPVMRVESQALAGLFGERFRRYADQVPSFLPRLSPYRDDSATNFDSSLYLRYREYRAALTKQEKFHFTLNTIRYHRSYKGEAAEMCIDTCGLSKLVYGVCYISNNLCTCGGIEFVFIYFNAH